MRNSKPFSPPDSSFSLNESIAFTSFPFQKPTLRTEYFPTTQTKQFPVFENLKLEPKASKNLSNFPNCETAKNIPNDQTFKNFSNFETSTNFEKKTSSNFSNNEKKTSNNFSNLEKNVNFEVSEKTGYNYISILKEFTDQSRSLLAFDYEPQINSFLCICKMNNLKKGQGIGSNKQEAKKQASKRTIIILLKESSTNYAYFSHFLNIEKGVFEEESFLQEKDAENETIVYLNLYFQQHFGQNPTFEYENSEKGFVVTFKGGDLVEIAEGSSKKLARQAVAKRLCERLGLNQKMSIIDKVALECQNKFKQPPHYSEFFTTSDQQSLAIQISCDKFCEEGVGKDRKDAKNSAAEKLFKKLRNSENNSTSLKENQKNKVNNDFLEDLGSEEEFVNFIKENPKESLLKKSSQKNSSQPLADITNKRNKFQDLFLTYAEDRLSKLLPNPNKDKSHTTGQFAQKLKDYDRQKLQPKEKDLKILEEILSEVLAMLPPATLNIDQFMPIGSYINNSLRSYKFELDVLAIYDSKNFMNSSQKENSSNFTIKSSMNKVGSINKEILLKIKDSFLKLAELRKVDEKFNLIIKEERGSHVLEISLEDNYKNHEIFHIIKIIPCSKSSPKLQIFMKINLEMMNEFNEKAITDEKDEELKIVRRVLKYIRDNQWPELKGEIVDILIYNITRKFSEIDTIRNIQRFFEFIALGGLSCNKTNPWFWGEFTGCFFDYIQSEISKDLIVRLERECKDFVSKGVDSLIKFN